MRIYGLTGGIASGKSEAARRFEERGIPVLDADGIGHEAIAPGGAATEEVVAAFGPDILTDGQVDRAKLGAFVFSDPEARARLNAIVHPAVQGEVARRCGRLAEAGERAAIVEAALLAEGGRLEPFLSGLILVIASREIRLKRLCEKRLLSREEAIRRLDCQTPPESKLALARWVLDNNGSVEDLVGQVDSVAGEILSDGA
ncbi:MAG: dephospho-CoA kinase [Candidatus Hydrogenedentes bacterium]|nr:dephospho-CoA kinase [Candidatus Hydrogenedentota bacterium]